MLDQHQTDPIWFQEPDDEQREFLARVDTRFAELVSMGAFTPEKQQWLSDYIEDIRRRGWHSTGCAVELAEHMYDDWAWFSFGGRDPEEIRIVARNPYPWKTVRQYKN